MDFLFLRRFGSKRTKGKKTAKYQLFLNVWKQNKCIKSFFKYRRLYSVTDMLSELGLTTFSDLFHDNVVKFKFRWLMASNDAIRHFTSAFVGTM